MRLRDLFFPPAAKCVMCGMETNSYGLCESCENELPWINEPACVICGGNMLGEGEVCIECKDRDYHFARCYCVLEYRDEIQQKILSFKNGGQKFLGQTFASLMERKYNEINVKIDMVIPIPINEKRLKERGFNQSDLLCEELPNVRNDVVFRIKDTPHQTGLNRDNRVVNLENAFKVENKNDIKNKTILLVDDIYTTGSTLNECAKTLLNAGAKKVFALCLARTPVLKQNIIN